MKKRNTNRYNIKSNTQRCPHISDEQDLKAELPFPPHLPPLINVGPVCLGKLLARWKRRKGSKDLIRPWTSDLLFLRRAHLLQATEPSREKCRQWKHKKKQMIEERVLSSAVCLSIYSAHAHPLLIKAYQSANRKDYFLIIKIMECFRSQYRKNANKIPIQYV